MKGQKIKLPTETGEIKKHKPNSQGNKSKKKIMFKETQNPETPFVTSQTGQN